MAENCLTPTMKQWPIYIILIVLASVLVSSVGNCGLDKEIYHPGETSSFECSCSIGNEQNQPGYIVFRNSSGTVLQSSAVNSNSCINNFFGDTYLFLSGQDFLGNATFSLNADGTGLPTNWGSGDDVNFDNFNVSGAAAFDCIISDITGISKFALGEAAAIQMVVKDGITSNNLINANCVLHINQVGGIPLHIEPYQRPREYMRSMTSGQVSFLGALTAGVFTTNTTYELEFHCFCINGTDEACYDETTSLDAGFKACTSRTLITASNSDNRGKDKYPQVFVLFTIMPMILGVFFLVGAVTFDKNEHVAMKTALYLLSLMTFFMSMYIGLASVSQFYEYTSLQESSTYIMWVVGVIIFIIISYFFMYLIVVQFKALKEKKRAARLMY